MRDRIIMHIDMNAFYASVAQHLDPSLRGKAVAVAGDPKRGMASSSRSLARPRLLA